VSTGPCNRKQHLGVDFAIWRTAGAWFWFLTNPRGQGGMIGASASEAQAICDACSSIEAILLRSVKYCGISKPETHTLVRRKSSRTVTIINRTQ
jgi:hypothetical protein